MTTLGLLVGKAIEKENRLVAVAEAADLEVLGAVIQGAKAPIVLTSRAASAESKLYSLALAILVIKN